MGPRQETEPPMASNESDRLWYREEFEEEAGRKEEERGVEAHEEGELEGERGLEGECECE